MALLRARRRDRGGAVPVRHVHPRGLRSTSGESSRARRSACWPPRLGRLYASTYYALRDTRTPLRYASLRVALTVGLGIPVRDPAAPVARHRSALGRGGADRVGGRGGLGGVHAAAAHAERAHRRDRSCRRRSSRSSGARRRSARRRPGASNSRLDRRIPSSPRLSSWCRTG